MPKKLRIPEKKYHDYDVVTVGSGTIDVFVDTENRIIHDKKTKKTKDLIAYPLGSKILIDSLKFDVGGGGTNTAVALSRFGLKTGWIGSIGRDENSQKILDWIEEEGIDFLGRTGKEGAGYSVILDSKGRDRTILTFKGENNNLKYSDIRKEDLETKWLYFCSMVGKSFHSQKRLAGFARRKGIKVAFNPSSYQAKLGEKKLRPILKNTDLLILNLEEAGMLVGEGSLSEMMEKMHKTGPGVVIVTDGAEGAYCSDGWSIYKAHARKVKIRETTGAGDSFASSFLGAMIKTDDIKKSLKIATINSESVVMSYGAKNVLLGWDKALKREKNAKIRITKVEE